MAESSAELEAIGEKATWAFHITKEEFAGCTAMDLVHYYNALPGTKEKVQRFSDRNTALRRLNAALELGLCEVRTGKQAVKPRKKRSDGSGAGRNAAWDTIAVSAAGKSDGLSFHKENARFKVFEVIKRRDEITRDALVKFCEDSLSIKRPQVMGAIGKLVKRGLVRTK